ncbi:MAG: fatty acid oxidation complex subunit alpha FadJ [Chloroflexota bacterium]
MKQVLTLERRDDQVGIIWFDTPDENVNLLRPDYFEQFDAIFNEVENDKQIRALVIASGKDDNFCAGADVNLLASIDSAQAATKLAHDAHRFMDRLADLPVPVVAAIHGTCVGGGLELVLATDARIASEAETTTFGLPEIKLGLIPGAGGTQRLPQTIGIEAALNLILTGNTISPHKAVRLDLIDEAVPRWILMDVAIERALALAETGMAEGGGFNPFSLEQIRTRLLEDNTIGRRVLFNQAQERVQARTHGNLPAPSRAINVIRTGAEEGAAAGYRAEANAFGELAMSPQARELMYLFQARQALKKEAWVDDSVEARQISRVGVLGAGLMGSGIAYITAVEAGLSVRLKDIDHEKIRNGLRSIHKILARQVEKGEMNHWDHTVSMTRIHPTIDYSGFGRAGLVIEAVIEKLELKHKVLREVLQHTPDDVILASNTSSIPIRRLAEVSDHPENVIGMHYFSPVHKLPLLEIIVTEQTAPDVIRTAVTLGQQQGKTVIVVNDGPGFYTTRILAPYISEAMRLILEGVPIETIDEALKQYGFPMGPVRLLDEVGIDVAQKIMTIMQNAFGERMSAPEGVDRLIEDERYGEKNGRGFYKYKGGDGGKQVDKSIYKLLNVKPEGSLDIDTIQRRCALQMINEAAYCYGEGILRSARDGDIGAVFGLGFPPFLGGPFRTIDAQGVNQIVQKLEQYQQQHGARFAPAPLLKRMAEEGLRFEDGSAPQPGMFTREGAAR